MQAELFDRPEPDRGTLPPDQREWCRYGGSKTTDEEAIWFSPACLKAKQADLFAAVRP